MEVGNRVLIKSTPPEDWAGRVATDEEPAFGMEADLLRKLCDKYGGRDAKIKQIAPNGLLTIEHPYHDPMVETNGFPEEAVVLLPDPEPEPEAAIVAEIEPGPKPEPTSESG